jgi:predicted enzyme related to lactoylglutathione lyase
VKVLDFGLDDVIRNAVRLLRGSVINKEVRMGRPVVHWELWSEDPEMVSEFYKKVFDWEIRHIPEMNYHLVETGGTGGIKGGIMKPQAGPWPGKMAFYIDVDDLDAYAERIKSAGG